MPAWVQETLNAPELGWIALPAMLVLGLLGSATNCCTPVVLGAMAGYSGSREPGDRRALVLAGSFFVVGTAVALAGLGAIAGVIGQLSGKIFGLYFKVGAGLVAILFGLAVLERLPIRVPKLNLGSRRAPQGALSAAVFGFFVGGASLACMVCCNPLVAVPLGVAAIHGQTLLGAGMLGAFAVGYSLPLAAVLIGLRAGFGRLQAVSQRLSTYVKTAAGVLLIVAGLYMLATV